MNHDVARVREQIVGLLPRLRRFARNLTRNTHDADDLVQIGVERALLRLDQWRAGTRLESWMFGILRNAWIDEVRSRGRYGRLFAPEEAGENVGDRSDQERVDTLSIQTAMAQLPEEQRTAVSLVLVEGLSYKEAAEAMDVPIGTLTSRLARGREMLARILSEAGNTPL
jgi:RNA polymerase sigma-70 factor, ECF subfamily